MATTSNLTDKELLELVQKVQPANLDENSEIYLTKDILNNVTTLLPLFFDRSIVAFQDSVTSETDWNKLTGNTLSIFSSTTGNGAPKFVGTENASGFVLTVRRASETLDKVFQVAVSISDTVEIALRGGATLDSATWYYSPTITDYEQFKSEVQTSIDNLYSTLDEKLRGLVTDDLQAIFTEADTKVSDIEANAKAVLDESQKTFNSQVATALDEMKTLQANLDTASTSISGLVEEKVQEANTAYESQIKDLEATYVKDVQDTITKATELSTQVDDLEKRIKDIIAGAGQVDLSGYYDKTGTDKAISTAITANNDNFYTKDEANDVISRTISGAFTEYYTSTQVDSALATLKTSYYTKDQIDTMIASLKASLATIDLTKYYTKVETNSLLEGKISGATMDGEPVTVASGNLVLNTPSIDLSSYVTKASADATYLSKTSASSTYATKESLSPYLTANKASSTYAPLSAITDFVTKTTADARYDAKGTAKTEAQTASNKAKSDAISAVNSNLSTNYKKVVVLTDAEYSALTTKDSGTLYLTTG